MPANVIQQNVTTVFSCGDRHFQVTMPAEVNQVVTAWLKGDLDFNAVKVSIQDLMNAKDALIVNPKIWQLLDSIQLACFPGNGI